MRCKCSCKRAASSSNAASFDPVSMVLQCSCYAVPMNFLGCSDAVSMLHQCSSMDVAMLLRCPGNRP
eukprot:5037294-Lingulodinium_polyedra.AAC.1